MVYYFKARAEVGDFTIYMGLDKHENEDLIKYGFPEDIWFHVDKLSSAHVYLRLHKGQTMDNISPELLEDCAQLVKANSIQGNKQNNLDVVYTPWFNLKKAPSMDVGQVGFHNPKLVRIIKVEKRINEIVNRLNKTRVEKTPDLKAEKELYNSQERAERKSQVRDKKRREELERQEKEKQAEVRSYKGIMVSEKMTSNKEIADTGKSFQEIEEDFIIAMANEICKAHVRLARFSAQFKSPEDSNPQVLPSFSRGLSKYEQLHCQISSENVVWTRTSLQLEEVIYEKTLGEGIAKITINRPHRRNAFTPKTVEELQRAFAAARDDKEIGVIILTGKGNDAFCSGGDQAVRGKHGYVGHDNISRLNVLDLQVQIRRLPKPVIAMVAGYAVGGGHVLHMICDITIAADNAVFGQTGPKVGSFDAGYGSSMMARLVGQKKAREMWFLAKFYTAQEALNMGLVNTVVPLAELEIETVQWCRQILTNSPTAIRVLKSALNAVEDGHAGLQELAGNATLLFYGSEEGEEGKKAYLEGRRPDFSKIPRLP